MQFSKGGTQFEVGRLIFYINLYKFIGSVMKRRVENVHENLTIFGNFSSLFLLTTRTIKIIKRISRKPCPSFYFIILNVVSILENRNDFLVNPVKMI